MSALLVLCVIVFEAGNMLQDVEVMCALL